jgi:hypothetical protein
MKHLITFALFFSITAASFAQESPFVSEFSIEKPHDFIWTDNLQNLYLISESGIEMYNTKGEMLFKNSQLNLGRITSVDFNFSLKPLLFFAEMNMVVMLDNTLSMQGNPVKLSNHNLNWVTVAAKSIDNHYWFFDMQNFELVRTDMSFKKVRSSGNVSQLLGFDIQPDFLVEHNNWLYVNNPETGILVFDIFGTYYKQIPITGLKNFQVTDRFIIYHIEEKLYQYDLRTFNTIEIPLPEKEANQARIAKSTLFLSDGKTVRAYRKI